MSRLQQRYIRKRMEKNEMGYDFKEDRNTEYEAYELIDLLLRDIVRIQRMVVEAREEVNALSPVGGTTPYPTTTENIANGIYDDHRMMNRYIAAYGKYALIHWEA